MFDASLGSRIQRSGIWATVVAMKQAGRVGTYRAMTIADLARLLPDTSQSASWRLVAEFLEEYRWEPVEARYQLLVDEPPGTGDERWDVLLAALAEHLAARDGRGAPAWNEPRRLRRFWFPFNTSAARVDAVVHAPAAFRRRGVFVAAHELEVA
jgi:hypothetical protein